MLFRSNLHNLVKSPTFVSIKTNRIGPMSVSYTHLIKLPEIEHSVEVDEAGNKVGLWSHRLFIFGLIALFAYEVEMCIRDRVKAITLIKG